MERTSRGLLLLPACFLVEVILGGPLGVYGGIPVRYLLFSVSCAVLAVASLVHGQVVRTRVPAMASIVAFVVINAVWIVVVPVLAGGRFGYALSEARAFAVLGFAVLLLAVVGSGDLRPFVRRFQLIVVVTSAMLALVQIAIWIMGTLFPELHWAVRLVLASVYSGAEDALYVGLMPDGFFRVFWISSLWLLLAIFWLFVVQRTWIRILLRVVLMLGLLVTYSRGIWLGALVGVCIAQAAGLTLAKFPRLIARAALTAAVVLGVVIGALAATGELERGRERLTSTTSTEDPSISIRLEQAHYLSQVWSEHELFGSGYGAYHPRYQRSSEAPFSYEHMPYAFLAKLGLVGVLVNAAFLLFWTLSAWRARKWEPVESASFLGGLAAFLVATMTNPMIINIVGMSMLGCLLLQWASIRETLERREHV